jgi:type I restriction enzyme R subunit
VRSLVGLDRRAVSDTFSEFIGDGMATAVQIEFIGLAIEHLTHEGLMNPVMLYENPVDIAPSGPEKIFDLIGAERIFRIIEGLNASAVA